MKRTAHALVLLLALAPVTAYAVDTITSTDAPDLTSVRAKIKSKDWSSALTELTKISDTVQHADVYNLLGFVNRNMSNHKVALTFYKKALDFNPDHKGAHEYMGELFVKTGDMAEAKKHEVILVRLCPDGCEELEDLRKSIASGPGTAASLIN
jgi:tetratricopeptide (TPR) repeat protein